jgi:hypothetical protein
MDELDKELLALRDATQGVTASQAFKSELLLAAARAGAGAGASTAATATTISRKLVLAFVAAGAAGGLTVWSLTREPEAPPPAASEPPAPPVVNVNVVVSPAPASVPAPSSAPVASTPPVAVAVAPSAPVAAAPALESSFPRCRGILSKGTLNMPTVPDLAARLEKLPHMPHARAVVAHVKLPEGKRATDVLAQAPISEDGWFVAEAILRTHPVWFVLPGYEPVGFAVDFDHEGPQYLGEVDFSRSVGTRAELAVHIDGTCSDLTTELIPGVCPDAIHASQHGKSEPIATQQGRDPVFSGLSATPFTVLARSRGCTSAELDVWGKPGRVDVPIALEQAKAIDLEYVIAKAGELCHAKPEHRAVVPGEHFTLPGTIWLWIKQRNQRLSFEKTATLTGGYLGHGPLSQYCREPTPAESFSDREILNGDVYMAMDMAKQHIVLMRFNVR